MILLYVIVIAFVALMICVLADELIIKSGTICKHTYKDSDVIDLNIEPKCQKCGESIFKFD